ncbi:type I-E CRISPR-associated endoribonuclease Cas2e [Microbacterium tumbae]
MIVLVLTACPPGLRGFLTRWLIEISAGVFVGKVTRRVRELLWERTVGMVRTGRAILVFSARNEQGLSFLVHGHHWEPIDIDGITLMLRPSEQQRQQRAPGGDSAQRPQPAIGWSKAARRRRT